MGARLPEVMYLLSFLPSSVVLRASRASRTPTSMTEIDARRDRDLPSVVLPLPGGPSKMIAQRSLMRFMQPNPAENGLFASGRFAKHQDENIRIANYTFRDAAEQQSLQARPADAAHDNYVAPTV